MDKTWLSLLDTAVDKLHDSDSDSNWSALSKRDQELAALWKLEMDMNNGGFVQFFCNWGIECYEISLRALEQIGASNMLKIVKSQFDIVDAVYQRSKSEIQGYWDIPQCMTDEEIEQLERLDEAYWAYPDDVTVLGIKHYVNEQSTV